jgi:hypothetical protein
MRLLHVLIAKRCGIPLLRRKIRKLDGLTKLIHDQIEALPVDRHRVDPEGQSELRRLG